MNILFFLPFFCCVFFPLFAEIEKVTVRWRPQVCDASCASGLLETFKNIPQVAFVEVDPAVGQATLTWKPNERFSFQPINYAMRWIGPSIQDLRVRVSGIILAPDPYGTISLVSLGDNTFFDLLGPIVPQTDRFVISQNIESHPLSSELRKKLLDAARNNFVVVISGPLFGFWRSTTLLLIVENLQIKPPEKNIPPR